MKRIYVFLLLLLLLLGCGGQSDGDSTSKWDTGRWNQAVWQ